MISTRQLIFIISIVFFFVNRATSGGSSSRASRGRAGASRESAEVNNAYLKSCILELTSAFQKHQNTFDNILYAFLNLNEADFIKRKTYTKAAYEYFHDLINTAHDMNQPNLQNPRDYCTENYKDKVESCLCSIVNMGCKPDADGIFCVKHLYLNWKKDDSVPNSSTCCEPFTGQVVFSRPIYDTEYMSDKDLATDMSDKDLATAISSGFNRFPGLTYEDVLSRLTDINLLKDFYDQNEDRRENIESLQHNSRYAEEYTKQREIDIRAARHECYGIGDTPYESLLDEQNRRQKIYKNNYAMFLYNQVEYWGKTQMEEEDKNKFQDPEKFCTNFLHNNPGYYKYLEN